MARGWESKDVESRQEQVDDDRRRRQQQQQGAEVNSPDRAREVQRESLLLTRTRVQSDLSRATHPRHRAQLEAALAHLDAEIAKLH